MSITPCVGVTRGVEEREEDMVREKETEEEKVLPRVPGSYWGRLMRLRVSVPEGEKVAALAEGEEVDIS